MAETVREKLGVARERVLLLGVFLPDSKADPTDPLGELRALAHTAGASVAREMIVRCRTVSAKFYVGSGKACQIAEKVQQDGIDTIIFDNDLSPAQIRGLEELTGRKVLDRSEVILDIFAAHARTRESCLEVELAQLEYTYPRLRHMWGHLERVAGGATTAAAAVGGIGTRGPGEKQIELDRRLAQKRVIYLKRKITEIDRRKIREIGNRSGAYCVCLVGYTNAGKSTLLNLLTGAGTYVADQLFATLATKTRRWNLPNGRQTLLSDTVGFIRDLPHHLIASFKATLEEAIHADLLIHVADASHSQLDDQIAAVDEVLDELGCGRDIRLLALNKIDKVADPATRTILARRYPQAQLISAVTGAGAAELAERVARQASGPPVRVTIQADCRNGRLMQYIAHHAQVESEMFRDATAHIEAVMEAQRIDQLSRFGDDVRIVRRLDSLVDPSAGR